MNESVYQVVTDRIVSLLERGVVPWQQPWDSATQAPMNLKSMKPYRGINVFLLGSLHYASPFFVSYKQAQDLGGNVKRGERGNPVIFWKWVEVDNRETGNKEQIPLLRYYSVFNAAAQCEGVPVPVVVQPVREHSPVEEAEKIVAEMPKRPLIRYGLTQAFYAPAEDYVGMPAHGQFKTSEDFYSVLFHELCHSTGHPSRLNRKGAGGTEGYALEELCAEIGAAFLCANAGIAGRTLDNSAAYLRFWVQHLKDDSKLVVFAAGQAQKAVDFILNRQATEAATKEVQIESLAA